VAQRTLVHVHVAYVPLGSNTENGVEVAGSDSELALWQLAQSSGVSRNQFVSKGKFKEKQNNSSMREGIYLPGVGACATRQP
jgi:hypothetical protein